MTFPIGCSVSYCSKTLPLNTSLFGETVFEKSRVFNLSRFKISIYIWWRFVRVRTFEITEWVFCSVLFWNQLWLSIGVNMEIRVFPGKVNLKRLSLLLQDEHIVVLCFYFSCWLLKCILCCRKMKKYFRLREDEQLGSFKINTTSWVLDLTKMSDVFNGCVLLISTMICFAFFWWKEWQVQDGVNVLEHFQHRDWLFGNAS